MIKIFGLRIMTTKEWNEQRIDWYNIAWSNFTKGNAKSTWTAINPVIHDLEKLKANTWDQDKITHIQQWLRENFEVRDDNK